MLKTIQFIVLATLCLIFKAEAQTNLCYGKITDQDGMPISHATIGIKGTKVNTISDQEGNFRIQKSEKSDILIIRSIGYQTQEITNNSSLNLGTISLNPDQTQLKEIEINAGYYTVKDRERTGSITKITSAQIGRQPVNNPLLALQGNTPGVQVTQKTGVPGGGIDVQIRGKNSIIKGNVPLYIVDGVIYPSTDIHGAGSTGTIFVNADGVSPMSMISPSDIQSIEILKDADATAIYGSRGANGVVLITTKKGEKGKTKVNVVVAHGINEVAHHVDLLNTPQYVSMRKEAYKNDGLPPGTTDYDVNGTWDQNRYTDWQKEMIGGTAQTSNASLNLSGGTAQSNYLIGGNYSSEGSVYPGNFNFNRVGMRASINLGAPEDRFKANFNIMYNRTKNQLPSMDLTTFMLLAPNQPDPYDQYGKLTWLDNKVILNPMSYLLKTYDATTSSLTGNLTLSYQIIKNLILKTSIGYTGLTGQELQKTPLASISPFSSSYNSASRVSYFANIFNNNFIAEPMLTYTQQLGPGKLDALAGISIQENNIKNTTIKASDFTSDDLMDNIGSAALLVNNKNVISQYRYFATFGRLNYNLADRYFLNLTARRDGSSRFGADQQFANFWAVGSAWIFSEESFFKDKLPLLSFGKLRASYGITGNDQIGDYGYLQLWNTGTAYQGGSTLTPGINAPNADFAWETNRKLETAIQLGFLKSRINLEISFYRNRSSNQLLSRSLPLSTGLTGLIVNLPARIENKGWEFDANVKILNSGKINWSAGLNLSIPKNKLLSYPGLETSNDASFYQVGQALNILKAYHVTVDSETGLYVTEDKNGNGVVDDADRYVIKFLGQQCYGGLSNSLKYGQFNFDFQLSYCKQNGKNYPAVTLQAPGTGLPSSSTANQYVQVLDRWQQPGNETLTQKFSTTSANAIQSLIVMGSGDLSITDASFLRLRNVSVGWTIPRKVLSSLKLSNGSITLQGQNLYTFTNYIGLDPETQSNLPPLRTLMLGLNLTF